MASPFMSAWNSRRTKSTKAIPVPTKSKRSSAYDADFRHDCEDNYIFHLNYEFADGSQSPPPANFDEIRQALKVPRGSLSPSTVPNAAFQDFKILNSMRSKGAVMRFVVPLIIGNMEIPNCGKVAFNNLASITNNTTVNPVPDFFDGSRPGAVDKQVREDLDTIIVPNKRAGVPLAPNFFLEAKGRKGTFEVAEDQAILDGAHGAFIMHALQNYLLDQSVYDGKAYSFSSVLISGYLTLLAHHLAAPVKPGGKPRCYATEIRSYALRDEEGYIEGICAFRNLRALAKEKRDRFINIANSRARRQGTEATDTEGDGPARTIEQQQDRGSSPLDFYDCQTFAQLEDDGQETQKAQEADVGLGIGHQDDADDTEVSTGLAGSLVSSFTSIDPDDHLRSKRRPKIPRSPPSPSSTRRRKASRTTRHTPSLSRPTTSS